MIAIIVVIFSIYIFLPIFVALFTDLACNVADWYRAFKKPKKVAKIYAIEEKDGVLIVKERNNS